MLEPGTAGSAVNPALGSSATAGIFSLKIVGGDSIFFFKISKGENFYDTFISNMNNSFIGYELDPVIGFNQVLRQH